MRKVIAAFNMTLDGVCDHTTGIADEELHHHYADLINSSGEILYGRITYQLMQYWQDLLKSTSRDLSLYDFAVSIDRVKKIVFSRTINETGWKSAILAKKTLRETVEELRYKDGGDILVGSRSLIIQLLSNRLIDELQICIHPVIEGNGLRLFDGIQQSIMLK